MTRYFFKTPLGFARKTVLTLAYAGGVLMMAHVTLLAQEATSQPNPRNVVELFTSQGCSSCPPADSHLAELAKDPNVLALSIPVDYWDYIGWKDTLAHPFGSARQYHYAAMCGDRNVFTPQAIINGTQSAVGSDAREIEQAFAASHPVRATLPLNLQLHEDNGALHITIANQPGTDTKPVAASLILMGVIREARVAIGRGENAGATITYTNVVSSLKTVSAVTLTGQPQDMTVSLAQNLDSAMNSYVILVQEGSLDKPGAILAASSVHHCVVKAAQVDSVKP